MRLRFLHESAPCPMCKSTMSLSLGDTFHCRQCLLKWQRGACSHCGTHDDYLRSPHQIMISQAKNPQQRNVAAGMPLPRGMLCRDCFDKSFSAVAGGR